MGWGGRLAGAVAAVVMLSGCGADPPARPSPPASASAMASASPAPSATAGPTTTPGAVPTEAPSAPGAAAERTADGIQAFVEYYVAVVNHAFAAGRTETLTELSAEACKTCATWIADIEEIYGAGGRMEGGQARLSGSSAAAPSATGQVNATVTVSERTDLDAQGRTLNTVPAEQGLLVFTLDRVDDGWRVREIRSAGG